MQTIVIAVGGTGGHVLPAMQIGKILSKKFSVMYIGVDLSRNRFFDQTLPYYDVEGAGFSEGLIACGRKNLQGIIKGRKLLKELSPQFVIGFGSFHSFPLLAGAAYLDIPYYLVELNVLPGFVNRLFSRGAKATYIHFEPEKKQIFGKLVKMDYAFEPICRISKEEARLHFGLQPDKKTLLVFGGSQGADAINCLVAKAITPHYQLLHFPGKETDLKKLYESKGVLAHVEPFCTRMDLAWQASDLAICRSGAGALREMLIYETPALFIPYPEAKDDHQTYNALYAERKVQGGVCLKQEGLTKDQLMRAILALEEKILFMRESILQFKAQEKRRSIFEVME